MNRKQLVYAGILLALLAANIITGFQFKADSEDYDKQLQFQNKLITQHKNDIAKQQDEIHKINHILNVKNAEIHTLTKRLVNARTTSESPMPRQMPSRGEVKNYKTYWFEITAYTSGYESTGKNSNDSDYGLTASGVMAKEGQTVACPKSLDFGTKLHIEGIGYRVCEDRGGRITSGKLDVYVEDLNKAINFGRKMVEVTILK